MGILTQRRTVTTTGASSKTGADNNKNHNAATTTTVVPINTTKAERENGGNNNKKNYDNDNDIHNIGTASSNDSSTVAASAATSIQQPKPGNSKGKTLKERSNIPNSFVVTFGTIIWLEYFSGFYSIQTLQSWYSSITNSTITLQNAVLYTYNLVRIALKLGNPQDEANEQQQPSMMEYVRLAGVSVLVVPLFVVFFVAPFRAGFWTGRKTRRHVFHRYAGLFYLIHYVLAWIELFTNPNQRSSYLCHIVAVNGILQGTSAYFSFKVLPELHDPGYYSDKAVLSRTFVHENIYFTLMACFGSVYYNETARTTLQSTIGGRIIEYIYVFWPFVAIRPWYPITRFSNAGQTYRGRSVQNQKFYEIATLMVKFFYLWAKYFLGYFMQFMIFLNLVKEEHWHFMNGMLLLNTGTVSLSIFLHTLRFKKVLPAKLTMTIYLAQIYLTFSAVPIILQMFASHPKLCGLCFAGLVGNATRNRKLHAVWCAAAMYLLTQTDIEW